MSDNFRWTRQEHDGAVMVITIDRPAALNALNDDVIAELGLRVERLAEDRSVRAVILTGQGSKAFVAGADIAAMSEMNASEAKHYAQTGHALMASIEALPQIVIAAVNGFALGGGLELALACDLIYAAESARFGQPEVKLGLMPGFGGTVRLPRKIGAAAACELILTGEMIGAEEAYRVGLVQKVVQSQDLLPYCRRIASAIVSRAPLAVTASKRAIIDGMNVSLEKGYVREREAFSQLFKTQDIREGTKAFLEKRDPVFEGM